VGGKGGGGGAAGVRERDEGDEAETGDSFSFRLSPRIGARLLGRRDGMYECMNCNSSWDCHQSRLSNARNTALVKGRREAAQCPNGNMGHGHEQRHFPITVHLG
jgi:hypothetical protein